MNRLDTMSSDNGNCSSFFSSKREKEAGLSCGQAIALFENHKYSLLTKSSPHLKEARDYFFIASMTAFVASNAFVVYGTAHLASPFSQQLPLCSASPSLLPNSTIPIVTQPCYLSGNHSMERENALASLPWTSLPLAYAGAYILSLWSGFAITGIAHSLGWGNYLQKNAAANIDQIIRSLEVNHSTDAALPESYMSAIYPHLTEKELLQLNFSQIAYLYESNNKAFTAHFNRDCFSQLQRCYWRFFEQFRKGDLALQSEMLSLKINGELLASEPLLFEKVVRAAHNPDELIPILFDRLLEEEISKLFDEPDYAIIVKAIKRGDSFGNALVEALFQSILPEIAFTINGATFTLPYQFVAERFPHFPAHPKDCHNLPEAITISHFRAFLVIAINSTLPIDYSADSALKQLNIESLYQVLRTAHYFGSKSEIKALTSLIADSFDLLLQRDSILNWHDTFSRDRLEELIARLDSHYSRHHLKKDFDICEAAFRDFSREVCRREALPCCRNGCRMYFATEIGSLPFPDEGCGVALTINSQLELLAILFSDREALLSQQLEEITITWLKNNPREIESYWEESIRLENWRLRTIAQKLYVNYPELFDHAAIPLELEELVIEESESL